MAKPTAGGRYFGPEAIRFLKELARNNNRDWFQKNKARYEEAVQAPALRFIEDMGVNLRKISPHVVADARPFGGSLSRIYRDTRFSKDKSPYKTNVGIHFGHDRAGKDENMPGFYLHLSPGDSMVASGIWHPAPPALQKIRAAIVRSPASWEKVVGQGIKIGGESYARVPAGFDANHKFATDLKRKDFYSHHAFTDSEVSASSFGTKFEAACRELDPLNRFLANAMDVPW